MAQWIAKALTIGCTATDFSSLRGSKPAREPGVNPSSRRLAKLRQ